MKKTILTITLATCMVLQTASFTPNRTNSVTLTKIETQSQKETAISTSLPVPEIKPEIKKDSTPKTNQKSQKDSVATIVSFGDTLCHKGVFKAAYDKKTKEYDFSPMFKYVEGYFENATISIGNCESPMAGAERGYSGYPNFNAPEHLAIDLKELGVDIMTTANNHALDKGYRGLESTLEFLEDAGIEHVGTARSEEEYNTILIKDLNGIKTAFLAYTYGVNGVRPKTNEKYCVNLMDNRDLVLEQIKQAKENGAELIVVSLHWGEEYKTEPNIDQEVFAKFLIKNGVDIILGSHPHVLQPMKMLSVKTKEGKKREGLVIFSQGNFFSNQKKENTQNTAIFNIEVKKDGKTGKVKINKVTYAPIYVNIKEPGVKNRYELLDLNEIIRSYEAGEKKWSKSMYKLALKEKEKCVRIIGPEIE